MMEERAIVYDKKSSEGTQVDFSRAVFPLLMGVVSNERIQSVLIKEDWRKCARRDGIVVLIDKIGRNCRLEGCFLVCFDES